MRTFPAMASVASALALAGCVRLGCGPEVPAPLVPLLAPAVVASAAIPSAPETWYSVRSLTNNESDSTFALVRRMESDEPKLRGHLHPVAWMDLVVRGGAPVQEVAASWLEHERLRRGLPPIPSRVDR